MEKFVNVEDPVHHSFLQKGRELKKELENLLGEFPVTSFNTKLKLHNVNIKLKLAHTFNNTNNTSILYFVIGTDGVLIYPSHPTPAPYHGLPLLRPFNPGYTAIFNVLGNPVTQVKYFKTHLLITVFLNIKLE